MKNIVLLLCALAFTFTSCNKKGCWKCTTRQQNGSGPFASGAAGHTTYCDKTEAEIRQLEQEYSGTQTHVTNGVSHTSSAVTECNK